MSAPLIQTVIPFDATQDYVLSFSYLGFQVRKNKVIIRDNTTNLIVYEQKIISTLLKHTVPAKRLTNGMTYNIQVQVYHLEYHRNSFYNNMDRWNKKLFLCSNRIIRHSISKTNVC